MRSVFRQSRAMLCAGVSLAALSLAYPLHAADLNPSLWTKAPVLDRGEWRGFIEGGVFWTGGDPVPFRGGFDAFFNGFNGGDCEGVRCFPKGSVPTARPGLGWDVAMGADYRFAGTPWHVNMEGRYGRVTKLDKSSDDPFYSSFSSFNNGWWSC